MTQWGLDTLFNPAKRHMDEEKRRLQSTREEVGDNSGGKRIDLESGKVVISRADADADADDDDDAAASDAPDAADSGRGGRAERSPATSASTAKSASATKDTKLSPAAERAAKRRARKPS